MQEPTIRQVIGDTPAAVWSNQELQLMRQFRPSCAVLLNGPVLEMFDLKEQYCRMEAFTDSVSDCRLNSFPDLISACVCFLAANCNIELHDVNDNLTSTITTWIYLIMLAISASCSAAYTSTGRFSKTILAPPPALCDTAKTLPMSSTCLSCKRH